MYFFFIFSTIILWAMHYAVACWFSLTFPILNNKFVTLCLPILLTLITVLCLFLSHQYFNSFSHILYYLGYTWFGFVFLAFCTVALYAVIYWIIHLLGGVCPSLFGYLSCLTLLVIFSISLYGGFSDPKIKKIQISDPTLPNLKIAILSDSHLGMGVSLNRFSKAVGTIKAQKPDILLVLGDVFEFGPQKEEYAKVLADLSTPLGSYGVLGNHEYYGGYQNAVDFFKQSKIHLLQNSIVELTNGLQIVGVNDIRTTHVTKQELIVLLGKAEKEKPLILLSHTPLYAEEAAQEGVNLMLSGHTHNGQIFPFNFLVKLQFPRAYGLFNVGKMKFYITSGMFYWGIPLRFLSPKEIPIIEVTHA